MSQRFGMRFENTGEPNSFWHAGRKFDYLTTHALSHVKKAVRWNSPFYGVEGMGWSASMHAFTRHVKVTFMNGGSLDPLPPLVGKSPVERWVNIPEDGLDEMQMANWVRQSAGLPGWEGF